MKYSGIGGQAVIEGIMMKNKDQYATAVRRPDGADGKAVETAMKKSVLVKTQERIFCGNTG